LLDAPFIKEEAARIGFADCRIAKAASLTDDAQHLAQWLREGMHGEMAYMCRNTEKRTHPALLVENVKTIVSLAINYFPAIQQDAALPQIAKYAYGTDYHLLLKDMLFQLLVAIKKRYGAVSGRAFTDSAPVMEHAWAARSGLGWTGKHSLTIHPKYGSYILLGELYINLEIAPDLPIADRCGSCTRCMDACPAKAIVAPHVVDARRCLSYLTIEYKGALSPSTSLHHWLFGCDICQDVCPWNKKATPTHIKAFEPNQAILTKTANEWQQLSEETFKIIAQKSPLQRAGLETIKKNASADSFITKYLFK
jgi:epoxyqueuosine reductase